MSTNSQHAAGKLCYVVFDVDKAFWTVPVNPDHHYKLAFLSSEHGLLEWNVMPFGVKNGPATYQRHIDTTLHSVRNKCRVFIDDGIC